MFKQLTVITVLSCACVYAESSLWESITKDINVKENHNIGSSRSITWEENLENYIKSHDVTVNVPMVGDITLSGRSLDNDDLDVKYSFKTNGVVEGRKKSKLKKIFIPIFIFIMLKAMTLIPLALGILGLKTWNAIQLSFFSFITSLGMAVWKLCTKVNHDDHIHYAYDHHPHILAARNDEAQNIAYSAHANNNINNNNMNQYTTMPV